MTEIEVTKVAHYIQVNVDPDGTPLCEHGDRMVEAEPNQWLCPDLIAIINLMRELLPTG